jgi:uncharacterized membrane protein AbrB (regulator of aidB expression)
MIAVLRQQWAFAVVIAVALAGGWLILDYHWREGTVLISGAFFVAVVLRIVVPEDKLGLVALRRKWTDVILYCAFGGFILWDALTITGGPFG